MKLPIPQTETVPPGQEESYLDFEVLPSRDNQEPFMVMTVYGPENALCLKFGKATLGDLILILQHQHEELKRSR